MCVYAYDHTEELNRKPYKGSPLELYLQPSTSYNCRFYIYIFSFINVLKWLVLCLVVCINKHSDRVLVTMSITVEETGSHKINR